MTAVLTNLGLQIIANRIKGNLTEPLNIAWGTGTTAPAVTDTDLETEDTTPGYARVAGVTSIVTVGVTSDTYQVTGAITAQAALTITEWGLFDTAGNLLCHEVDAAGHVLPLGGILSFIFKVQMSRCS